MKKIIFIILFTFCFSVIFATSIDNNKIIQKSGYSSSSVSKNKKNTNKDDSPIENNQIIITQQQPNSSSQFSKNPLLKNKNQTSKDTFQTYSPGPSIAPSQLKKMHRSFSHFEFAINLGTFFTPTFPIIFGVRTTMDFGYRFNRFASLGLEVGYNAYFLNYDQFKVSDDNYAQNYLVDILDTNSYRYYHYYSNGFPILAYFKFDLLPEKISLAFLAGENLVYSVAKATDPITATTNTIKRQQNLNSLLEVGTRLNLSFLYVEYIADINFKSYFSDKIDVRDFSYNTMQRIGFGIDLNITNMTN